MKRSPSPKPISSVVRREQKIDPKPEYQRGLVWSLKQRQLLIDTILRDLDIPKFYLRSLDNQAYEAEIVDGQQRLRAIWDFRKGTYRLSKDADDIDGEAIANKRYEDLSENLKDKFDSYTLDIVELRDCTQDEVEEMFVRLQNGSTLKAAEKRNALPGQMRIFIRHLAMHEFFSHCGFENKRFEFDQVAAQCTLLELNGGPRNIKNQDLERMYLENQDFSDESAKAKKISRVLNFLTKAFPEKTPELKRFNVVSLYILSSMLLENYASSDIAEKLGHWFIEFESKRSAESELPEDERDSELAVYQNATSHSTDAVDSLNYRNDILSREFFNFVPDIVQLDQVREFRPEQRLAIFRRDKGICQIKDKCQGKKLGWDDDWHVDHKIPYSKGGPTTVMNGQIACSDCNLAKGAD